MRDKFNAVKEHMKFYGNDYRHLSKKNRHLSKSMDSKKSEPTCSNLQLLQIDIQICPKHDKHCSDAGKVSKSGKIKNIRLAFLSETKYNRMNTVLYRYSYGFCSEIYFLINTVRIL